MYVVLSELALRVTWAIRRQRSLICPACRLKKVFKLGVSVGQIRP